VEIARAVEMESVLRLKIVIPVLLIVEFALTDVEMVSVALVRIAGIVHPIAVDVLTSAGTGFAV